MMSAIKIANNFIKSFFSTNKVYAPVEALPEDLPVFIKPTLYEYVKNYYKKNSAPWKEINVFGIRDERGMDDDILNDWICIADSRTKKVYKFKGSCDPGVYYTNHMISSGLPGVAHIADGFHENVYMVGLHRGKYEALIQIGAKIRIWRDIDKNYKQTRKDKKCRGWFGTNIHRMSDWKILKSIGRYSAGCQIIADPKEFKQFLSIIKNSKYYKRYRGGSRFSYMIITINEIPMNYLS